MENETSSTATTSFTVRRMTPIVVLYTRRKFSRIIASMTLYFTPKTVDRLYIIKEKGIQLISYKDLLEN
jgi:hypothetical protein